MRRYESTYFDTTDLECYRAAAHGRPHRFKVRTRTYLDTDTTMLEIKTQGRRGLTVKQRRSHPFEDRAALDGTAVDFIDTTLARPGLGNLLWPTLTTTYQRTTLVDLDDIARVTIDSDLRCSDWNFDTVELNDQLVIETKSCGAPSAADRHLWSLGVRPTKISKFGTGLAALRADLPSNKWHRTLQRHFTA